MNIPRHKYNPIDSSIIQRMRNYKKLTDKPIYEKIRRVVKEIHGVDPFESNGCRNGELVQARQFFIAMMVRHSRMKYETIGSLIGKDHSTVSNTMKAIKNLRETDKYYDQMFKEIDTEIKSNLQ